MKERVVLWRDLREAVENIQIDIVEHERRVFAYDVEQIPWELKKYDVEFPSEEKWILTREDLPELDYNYKFEDFDYFSSDVVLVTLTDGSVTTGYCEVEKQNDEMVASWYSEKDTPLNVLAWMPMPDPYEEE